MAEAAGEGATVRLTAKDPESAADALSDEYLRTTIKPAARQPFRFELTAFALPHLRFGEVSISVSSLRTEASPLYVLCVPTEGALIATADIGAGVVRGTERAIISPGARMDVKYLRDIGIRTVHFAPLVVQSELSALIGRSVEAPPRFDLPLRPGPGVRVVDRVMSLLHDELQAASPLVQEPALVNRVMQMLVSALLLSQPHSHARELADRRPGFEGPRAIRSLLGRMEAAPMDFVTVGDLAAAAGLSVRSLEEAFRRHVGVAPMTHLRQLRLRAAHTELLNAAPGETTVNTIARRWGFAHQGRFAALYRRQFGVSPLQDLRGRCAGDSAQR